METLADRIERDGPLNELDAVGWTLRLARRIEALHGLGVAHGSLSAACVLTESASRTSRGVLTDLRRTTGSAAYHSPERARGANVSQADDTWALGMTLYALLTGAPAFAGPSDDDVRQRILSAAPAPLAVFDVGDDDLQRILDDMFVRDPQKRLRSVKLVREELEKWHPDPSAKELPPLDEEPGDDGISSARLRPSVPRVDAGEDDEDDDARTVLRGALTREELDRIADERPAWAPAAGARRPARPLPPMSPPPQKAEAAEPLPKVNDSIPPEDNAPTQVLSAALFKRASLAAAAAPPSEPPPDDDDDARTVMRPALGLQAMAAVAAGAVSAQAAARAALHAADAASAPEPQPPERPASNAPASGQPESMRDIARSVARLSAPASAPGVRLAPPPPMPSFPEVAAPAVPEALTTPSAALAPTDLEPVAGPSGLVPATSGGAAMAPAGSRAKLVVFLLLLLVVAALGTYFFLSHRAAR